MLGFWNPQVAASGGYMMACTADHLVAAPLAILGSIGVITEIPNFYERLTKEGIVFNTITAGKFKRQLTPTKKTTPQDIKKTEQVGPPIFTRQIWDFVSANEIFDR